MNVLDTFSLVGKVALVTGCKRGIGKGMAIALAEAGADIIGVSASLALTKSEIEKEINALGRNFKAYQCDFSNRDSLYQFITQVQADFPVIDILVNNAGTVLRKSALDHTDEGWDNIIAVNQSAQFILSREIARNMLARKRGKIIFTASLLSFQGGITVTSYAVSKHAVAGLTKALANEWASSGVNVNAIAPGYIATDLTEPLRNNPGRYNAILERIPAGRWGHIDDFKGPIVFLASSASDYVNGEILTVDGGWMGR
jgi:2-deoxy-D-gluconate 3-dehydrogenase